MEYIEPKNDDDNSEIENYDSQCYIFHLCIYE